MTGQVQRQGIPSSTGAHVAVGARDARTGLGYCVVNPKLHLPRSANNSYPYRDDDEFEDLEAVDIGDDAIDAVLRKSINHLPTDHLAAKGTEPFYFAAGNTKLSDCFWRIEAILLEVAAFGDSMAAVPQLNKRKGPSLSGYSHMAAFPGAGGGNYRRTGSLQGYSKAPPPGKVAAELESDELEEEGDIYTLEDLAKKMLEF